MSKYFKDNFFLGFCCGAALFVLINFIAFESNTIDHPPTTQFSFGFPYKFYILLYDKYTVNLLSDAADKVSILYPELLKNFLCGLIFTTLVGLLFKFSLTTPPAKELE